MAFHVSPGRSKALRRKVAILKDLQECFSIIQWRHQHPLVYSTQLYMWWIALAIVLFNPIQWSLNTPPSLKKFHSIPMAFHVSPWQMQSALSQEKSCYRQACSSHPNPWIQLFYKTIYKDIYKDMKRKDTQKEDIRAKSWQKEYIMKYIKIYENIWSETI